MTQDQVTFRAADESDLPAIVALLADDELGRLREDPKLPLAAGYVAGFRAVAGDPNQILAVAVDDSGKVIGTLQITLVPGIARKGARRGQIEAVRIAPEHRGAGLGRRMFEWAIARCRTEGCALVQLTSDKARPDAHRFYEQLGFTASHVGFKLEL